MNISFSKAEESRGFTVLELLLAGGAMFVVVAIFQILFLQLNATQRDVRRLADMREAERVWQQLFRETGSFASALKEGSCATVGALVSGCDFSRVGVSLQHLVDPGKFAYTLAALPTESSFSIAFRLERSHGNFAAGEHVLTEKGIQ